MTSAASAAARRLLEELAAAPINEGTRETLARLIRAAEGGRPSIGILAASGRDKRDDLLRALARQDFPDLAVTTIAKAIAAELRRYAAGRWLDDRKRRACPYPDGTKAARLFAILSLGGSVDSIAVKTIVRVLTAPPSVDTNPPSDVHGGGCR